MANSLIDGVPPTIKSEIKKSIVLKSCPEHTHIFVLAQDRSKNKLTSIVYNESTPIGGYAYDAKFGRYYVDCAASLDLGTIPISFSIKIDKIGRWECRIPLREATIAKYLDQEQKEKLYNFKKQYRKCRFEFLQLVSCY